MLFKEFANVFLRSATTNNKPSEVQEKERILRLHLVPFFGELELAAIGYEHAQDFVALKLESCAHKTVKNLIAVFHRLLVVARKRRKLEHVPEIEWPRVPPPAFDFLTFSEADHLTMGSGGQWRRMIVLALRTGLRLGELLALAPSDVNLVAGKLEVQRSITRGVVTAPKTWRSRTIPLSEDARAALAEQMDECPGRIVFAAPSGGYMTASMARRGLERECRRARMRRLSWKIFRHSFASHLVMCGVPLKAVQELLGHTTIAMTLRYAHLAPEIARDAVQLLDQNSSSNWPPRPPSSPRRLGSSSSVTRRLSPSGETMHVRRPARTWTSARSSASR